MNFNMRYELKIFCLVLVGFVGSVTSVNAANITISPGSSIQNAVSSASTGDTITVNAGTYNERVNISKSVKIVCSTQNKCQMKGFDVHANSVTVSGFFIKDATQTCFDIIGNNIVIENNRCETVHLGFSDADGVNFFGDNNKFLNNYFLLDGTEYRRDSDGHYSPHPDCFQTWATDSRGYASNTVFDGNTCVNLRFQEGTNSEVKGQGFMMDGISGSGQKLTNNITIRGNIMLVYRGMYALNINTLKIENNVFSNNLMAGSGLILDKVGGTTIKNNIFYNIGSNSISNCCSMQTPSSAGWNWHYRTSGAVPTSSEVIFSTDNRNVNPQFLNTTDSKNPNYFHLQSGSPACTAGDGKTYVGAFPCGSGSVPPPAGNSKPGDVNGDALVNVIDIGLIIDSYGKNPSVYPKANLNGDSVINIVDIGIVISNYGK